MSGFSRFDGCYRTHLETIASYNYKVFIVACMNNQEGAPTYNGEYPEDGTCFILEHKGREYKYDFGSELERAIKRIEKGDL